MKTAKKANHPGRRRFPDIFWRSRDGAIAWTPAALFFLLFWAGYALPTKAQINAPCGVICSSDQEDSFVLLALDDSCRATIYAASFMTVTGGCGSPKFMQVRTATSSQLLGSGTDSVRVDLSGRIGQLLRITVTDPGVQFTCTGFARSADLTPPRIMCRDTILPCSADTSVAALGRPIIRENCDAAYTVSHFDQVEIRNCGGDTSAVILRRWTTRDRFDNRDTCIQRIVLLRAKLDEVVFPKDTLLSCSALSTHPDSTGYPLWLGRQIIRGGGLCRFNVTYTDFTSASCGNGIGRRIDRFWTVTNLCNGEEVKRTQHIEVRDTTPPVITCPPNKTVRTAVGQCFATVLLDRPVVTDNCDPDATFLVSTSYGQVGIGPHFMVPEGVHTITYTAIDACGNTTICTSTLTVLDDERPIAICDDELVISLNQSGTAFAAARVFNEGSKDNCVKTLYYKVRRMDIGGCGGLNGDDSTQPGYQEWFDDIVFFCCEDVGPERIPVVLRVYTVNPGPGPVDPAREAPGGDLFGTYNECMSMVQIKDPIPPQIYCPQDVTVECTEDLTDLSRFGSPVVLSGCGFTLDSTVVVDIDHCGRGTIKRTFIARNKQGLTAMCMQVITVVNNQRLELKDITWPKDVVLTTCGASVNPDNLPLGSRRPQIARQPACGLVGISHEDKLYDVVSDACFKIFRTWTLIDWCVYNPAVSATVGKYTHTQIIRIDDTEPPKFVCPPDIVVAATNGCISGQVTLPALTATDNCSPRVTITHDSPFASSPGANVSGTYPLGTTVVTYRISDGCGNSATCKVRITVVDQKPPSIICIEGLSTSLARMPGGIMAMVDAEMFNKGTTDNCSSPGSIRFTIRRASKNPTLPPTTTQLIFDCSDLGEQPVEVWATDEAGNSSYCLTTIRITDFENICPPDIGLGVVAGAIQTSKGDRVEHVKITLRADKPMEAATDVLGAFRVANVPLGHDYTLAPHRNDYLMNGVSTIDVIQLSRHILGVQPFTSPYQWIAADLDRSGTVTTFDVIRLRRLILNIDTTLPNGNTSWRFVDADYKFPPGQNPLQAPFPEVKNFNNFRDKNAQANFIAIKVGDINGSAISNSLMQSESRTTGGDMLIEVADRKFRAGETFTVDLTTRKMDQISGYQFTLDFDERLLELEELIFGDLPEMGLENFGFGALDQGRLITSWNKGNAQLPGGELVLFSLRFKARRASELSNALKLSERPTQPEAYNAATELMQVLLLIKGEDGKVKTEGSFELFQNYPNPFSQTTQIGFSLPRDMEAQLQVFDVSGRMLYQHKGAFQKGYNEVFIERSALNAHHGMLYYRLSSGEFSATKKMTLTGQ